MKDKLKKIIGEILENQKIETSAPCRIDLGGTLDISTFNYPLRHLNPCTFNIAIGLRTRVKLFPYKNGFVKISSKGFKPVEYPSGKAPFNNELGLMFAIAEYFHADGVHILIDSESPTRSALGGSSVAAVALIGAFSKLYENLDQAPLSKKNIAHLAWQIESFVAGTTCGIQDMLAAAYGGVNAWYWRPFISDSIFVKKTIIKKKLFKELEECLLLAYCGIPHESLNINGKWMSRFCSGQSRDEWANIIKYTHRFINSISDFDIKNACKWMNNETDLRCAMTPEVFDELGNNLFESAKEEGCGARFTGAGGGGCIWALGEKEKIAILKIKWENILSSRNSACLLKSPIDSYGLLYN